MMLNCTHRDDIISDVEFMKRVAKDYEDLNTVRLPIVVVVNKCDEMAPSRHKTPADYPAKKLEKIEEMVKYYKRIIIENGLKIDHIIPVSSLIDWMTPDGMEVAVEEINNLPQEDIENLEIAFDGRYRIDELLDLLEDAIQDFEAQMGLRMAARLNEVVMRFAKHLTKIFSGMAATVALTPIPVSDFYILLLLQSILVSLIASLSGRELSLDSSKEFIASLGGVTGAGIGFRALAQQSSKLVNLLAPGAGSAISSSIAFAGTTAIGKAAIAHYLEGKDFDMVKGFFEEVKEKL